MRRFSTLWLLTTATVAISGEAIAQTITTAGGSAQTGNVPQGLQSSEEIIVTAQKRAQRLIDVPQSVSVISADQLQQVHAERFQDFFTRVPRSRRARRARRG